MKILLGFFIGTTFALLLVVGLFRDNFFAASETGEAVSSVQSNSSLTTAEMDVNLPDIKHIYDVALGAPYRQVESEITDPDIAAYYQRYMEETGLNKIGLEE
jgi:hypothetical protein